MKLFSKLSYLRFLPLLLLLAGCGAPKQAKAAELQADLTVREIKSDIADFRYHLNSYQVELQILEGKVSNQEIAFGDLREQFLEVSHSEREIIESKIASLEKKITQLENHDESVLADIKKLKNISNSTSSSLEQFKTQIDQNEKLVLQQNRQIESLDKTILSLQKIMDKNSIRPLDSIKHYTVKNGDSLETIASHYDITVEELKKKNQLLNDVLTVGQELQLP